MSRDDIIDWLAFYRLEDQREQERRDAERDRRESLAAFHALHIIQASSWGECKLTIEDLLPFTDDEPNNENTEWTPPDEEQLEQEALATIAAIRGFVDRNAGHID